MLRRQAQLPAALLAMGDLVATAAGLVLAYALRFGSGLFAVTENYDPTQYLLALPPAALLCLASFAVTGSYRTPAVDLRGTVGAVLAATLLLFAGALLYQDRYQFSRGVLAIFPFLAGPLVWIARRLALALLRALHARDIGVGRALVVGAGRPAEALVLELSRRPFSGVRLLGGVTAPEQLGRALEEHRPEDVFVAFPEERHEDRTRILAELAEEMVDVRLVPDLGPLPFQDASLVGGLPVLTLQETPFFGIRRLLKRSFDLLLGLVFLVLTLPVMALVALLVRVTSAGPVLYRQERMGLDGRRFTILKFRTMVLGAEDETGAVWATKDDPRCTAVGRWLRRLSLDELPQLVNVLRGEMSLVGPRPERPVLIEEFRKSLPRYMLRHRIPAGLTGWAQVHGLRGESGLEERLRLDLAYLERWSLLLDLEILLRTVWHVLLGRNAA